MQPRSPNALVRFEVEAALAHADHSLGAFAAGLAAYLPVVLITAVGLAALALVALAVLTHGTGQRGLRLRAAGPFLRPLPTRAS